MSFLKLWESLIEQRKLQPEKLEGAEGHRMAKARDWKPSTIFSDKDGPIYPMPSEEAAQRARAWRYRLQRRIEQLEREDRNLMRVQAEAELRDMDAG